MVLVPVLMWDLAYDRRQQVTTETVVYAHTRVFLASNVTVIALWQCALYQMKAGSFNGRLIPNILIYYASPQCMDTLQSDTTHSYLLSVFLQLSNILTKCEGSAIKVFPQNWFVSALLIITFQSLFKQKMFFMQVCTFFKYGILGFLYDVIDL